MLFFASVTILMVSFLSALVWGGMLWARFWPSVPLSTFEIDVDEVLHNKKIYYKVLVAYSYSIKEEVYFSHRASLFGVRLYTDKIAALKSFELCDARVCPADNRVSYLKQEPRLFWGLLAIFVIGFPVGGWMIFFLG